MDINYLPFQKKEKNSNLVYFYSPLTDKNVPKNAKKVSSDHIDKLKNNLKIPLIYKDLGGNKQNENCLIWSEIIDSKVSHSDLFLGRNNRCYDYLVVYYNEFGNAIKVVHLRKTIFEHNEKNEILNFKKLDKTKVKLYHIFELFDINLTNYEEKIKNIEWYDFYN